jgi:hypothetical protein
MTGMPTPGYGRARSCQVPGSRPPSQDPGPVWRPDPRTCNPTRPTGRWRASGAVGAESASADLAAECGRRAARSHGRSSSRTRPRGLTSASRRCTASALAASGPATRAPVQPSAPTGSIPRIYIPRRRSTRRPDASRSGSRARGRAGTDSSRRSVPAEGARPVAASSPRRDRSRAGVPAGRARLV